MDEIVKAIEKSIQRFKSIDTLHEQVGQLIVENEALRVDNEALNDALLEILFPEDVEMEVENDG